MNGSPIGILSENNWGEWLSEINQSSKEQYDFVALIHWSGILMYNFHTHEYEMGRIDRVEKETLDKLAYLTTIGIYKDSDPEWN